jgi:uncharacterized protein
LASSNFKVLHKERAILIEEKDGRTRKVLIVCDLHIGFEEKFKISGVSIGTQIYRMASELRGIIEKHKVDELVIDGDVKSSIDRISSSEWENVPKFLMRMQSTCKVSIVPGNHDGGLEHLIPEGVKILDSNGVLISRNLVIHGYTRPLMKFSESERIILGHVHPVFQKRGSPLSGTQVWVFAKVRRNQVFREILPEHQNEALELVFMPAFNSDLALAGFAYEAAKQERKIAPILRDMQEVLDAAVVTLDGDIIGDASILPDVL